jgi:hypothetical protein
LTWDTPAAGAAQDGEFHTQGNLGLAGRATAGEAAPAETAPAATGPTQPGLTAGVIRLTIMDGTEGVGHALRRRFRGSDQR